MTDTLIDIDLESNDTALARPEDILPAEIYIMPLTERPFFPAQIMPMLVPHDEWIDTVKAVGEAQQRLVGLLLQDTPDNGLPTLDDYRAYGSVVRIHDPQKRDSNIQFMSEGIARFEIVKWLSKTPPMRAQVRYPEEDKPEPVNIKAWSMAIIEAIKELLPLDPLYKEELKTFIDRFGPDDPSPFADFAANLTTASRDELQDVLETLPLIKRMEKVLSLVKKEVKVARIQARIRDRVQDTMDEQQRNFFLREQLKEIQKELGILKDDKTAEIDRFRDRLKNLSLPDDASERINDELEKMSVLEVGSPEYGVTRNYLDWLTALPWGKYSKDHVNLKKARQQLDADHYGLDDVKDRIVEYLAVGALRGKVGGSIILLVGPPGVGKTSIGKSIAAAVGRQFYRFSLGGMRDEAEIKGHRRTYIGAMPGKFVQAIKSVGVSNPVIMLDEIDKVGVSYQGDPASALLEVLDPEQNVDFLDHYLDVRFDLSQTLFICTANQLDTIPGPLLDRMEIIHLAGYLTDEKVQIAKRHLWPKIMQDLSLKQRQLAISSGAFKAIIEGYAREAGVRNLEKRLKQIARKASVKLVQGKSGIKVNISDIEDYLGPIIFRKQKIRNQVGVITGLAWTTMGGAVLDVEATVINMSRRGMKLTGQLGGVMKESAEIAYSYIEANAKQFDLDSEFFRKALLHIHVPAGATPKDGPSAGITMACAILSLARRRRPLKQLAMTGELTITGQVLPIGGVREKLTAAKRAGVKTIILPADNEPDFEKLPEHIRKGLSVHFAAKFDDVAEIVFA